MTPTSFFFHFFIVKNVKIESENRIKKSLPYTNNKGRKFKPWAHAATLLENMGISSYYQSKTWSELYLF